jgi:hypothetical protein
MFLPSRWPARAFAALILVAASLLEPGRSAAQGSPSPASQYEYWPEVQYFQRLTGNIRVMAQATTVFATNGEPLSNQLGINADFSLNPTPFRAYVLGAPSLVDDRHRPLTLRVGYRYSEQSEEAGGKVSNRLLTELTARGTLFGLVASERNGFDWIWSEGSYSTRYRNRLQLEHTATIDDYQLTPYANAELVYLLSSGRWNQVRYRVGVQLPIVERVTFDFYGGYNVAWYPTPGDIYALGFRLIISL